MILCIPFTTVSPVNYGHLAGELRKKNGNLNHTLLVVCRPEDHDAAFDFVVSLSKTFGDFYAEPILKPGSERIDAANQFLFTALRFLHAYKRKDHEPEGLPLLYLDPAYRPSANQWLNGIQAEYYLRGAPSIMSKGKEDYDGGILFSPKYAKESALVNFLPPDQHWRKFLSWELLANAVSSDSIGSLIEKRPDHAPKSS